MSLAIFIQNDTSDNSNNEVSNDFPVSDKHNDDDDWKDKN